jgi:hypothetical protein
MFRIFSVLVVVAALIVIGTTSEAAQKKKGAVVGVVIDVQKDSLKVITKAKKGIAGEEKTVSITKDTKIEKVTGKKGQQEKAPATLENIQKGAQVAVYLRGDQPTQAERIEIVAKKK